MGGIYLTVGQHNVVYTFRYRLFRHFAQPVQCFLQAGFSFRYFKQHRQFHSLETLVADIAENIQLCVA